MEWRDQGIVLSVRRFGETSIVLDVLSKEHGRHGGLVRGGRSKRLRAALQPGNTLDICWRARLEEHLGNFTIELVKPRAALVMDDAAALAGLSSLCALLGLLAEREPHADLYAASIIVLDALGGDEHWPMLMARWELGLLAALGFGLDLSSCAANGGTDNLIYVSPKSARAVSKSEGLPYHDKLLKLPDFMKSNETVFPQGSELADAFGLTGYFLERHVFAPRGAKMPDQRARMIEKTVCLSDITPLTTGKTNH